MSGVEAAFLYEPFLYLISKAFSSALCSPDEPGTEEEPDL